MTLVVVLHNDVNRALRVLKKKVQNDLKLYRERQRFEKPCVKRRRKQAAARLRSVREKKKREDLL